MDPLCVIPPSRLAISSLDTIPQSTVPTPSQRESPPREPTDPVPPLPLLLPQPHRQPPPAQFPLNTTDAPESSSRRMSAPKIYHPVPGSYFPSTPSSSSRVASGTTTPSERERPRPPPLNMPIGTPDDPIFSAYPLTGGTPSAKGKAKVFSLAPIDLAPVIPMSPHRGQWDGELVGGDGGEGWMSGAMTKSYSSQSRHRRAQAEDSAPEAEAVRGPTSPTRPRPQRKRSATVSHSPADEYRERERRTSGSDADSERGPSRGSRLGNLRAKRSLRGLRRRSVASADAPPLVQPEFEPIEMRAREHWPDMAEQVAQRFESSPTSVRSRRRHFAAIGVEHALQSDSTSTVETTGTAKQEPLVSPSQVGIAIGSPSMLPRSASFDQPRERGLGLSQVDVEDEVGGEASSPRKRSSSLDFQRNSVSPRDTTYALLDQQSSDSHSHDHHSLSTSHTASTASASADAFSPTSTSLTHPLSSATTSISRSAKSGKEGNTLAADNDLDALQLERSIAWERKQSKHHLKLLNRQHKLFELVETEVGYTEDLRILSTVYQSEMEKIPGVNETNIKMIVSNASELYEFHARFSQQLVAALKEEGLTYPKAFMDGDEMCVTAGVKVEDRSEERRESREQDGVEVKQQAGEEEVEEKREAGDAADGETSAEAVPESAIVEEAPQLGEELSVEDMAGAVERAVKKVMGTFVNELEGFSLYKQYCADSIVSCTLVKNMEHSESFRNFEHRARLAAATAKRHTLRQMLLGESPQTLPVSDRRRHKLGVKDYLVYPVQRICRYPLLLSHISKEFNATAPASRDELAAPEPERGEYDTEACDVGLDVERALRAMGGMAEDADEARRLSEAKVKTETVRRRMVPHWALTRDLFSSLGTCRLIGALDVLYQHPTAAPLSTTAKVKYLGAFLFRGYLILTKVKKNRTYEARHWLPLEVFDIIDIAQGFLPHSIRLSVGGHNFDLGASCEAEKRVWAAAITEAREQATSTPFELPSSVSLYSKPLRRMSTGAGLSLDLGLPADSLPQPSSPPTNVNTSPTSKRHTLGSMPTDLGDLAQLQEAATSRSPDGESKPSTPMRSPIRTTFTFTPERKTNRETTFFRRASLSAREVVESMLSDVFSESCATARGFAKFQQDMWSEKTLAREKGSAGHSTAGAMIRRRRSFLDMKTTGAEIAFSGEVRGSVIGGLREDMNLRRSYHAGMTSAVGGDDWDEDEEGSTTAQAMSEQGGYSMTRNNSLVSFSPAPTPKRSFADLRTHRSEDSLGLLRMKSRKSRGGSVDTAERERELEREQEKDVVSGPWRRGSESRRSKAGKPRLAIRAKSTPVTPVLSPTHEIPPSISGYMEEGGSHLPTAPPMVKKSASDESTLTRKKRGGRFSPPEYSLPPPHGTPLGAIGSNIPLPHAQPPLPSSSYTSTYSEYSKSDKSSTLRGLRRSMSFLSTRSRSVTSMEDFRASAVETDLDEEMGMRSGAGGLGLGVGEKSLEDIGMRTPSLPGTPSRKKSIVKLLGFKSGFTPMGNGERGAN
ncbi:hypothetical protein IAT38_004948 [Cryptococcus sp. DSM 104549]